MPTVTKEQRGDRVAFAIDGEPFTAYVFGDATSARPYWYPLLAPGGVGLTRRFPMEAGVEGEPTDHPHHRSVWGSHGNVNGSDNWNEPAGKHGYIRFRRLEDVAEPDRLVAHSDWTDKDDALLCHERLEVRVSALPSGARMLDWTLTLRAPEGAPVTLGDTKEGGLVAVRLAAPLQGKSGGTIENAEGGRGEAECWGKPSRWCDCHGAVPDAGGETFGVAILSHPQGFGFPAHWHVRAYGLFAANPLGLGAFTNGAEKREVTLQPGESLTARYAVVAHRGDPQAAGV